MKQRILIVDDEPDIAFTFKLALEENGFKGRVDVYNDPRLALNDFKANSYALLLLDIAMPEMDAHDYRMCILQLSQCLYQKRKLIDSITILKEE